MGKTRFFPKSFGRAEGMGMLKGTPGAPTGGDYGPSHGRGLGVGSTIDHRVANTPLSPEKAQSVMQNMQHGETHQMPGMKMEADVSPNANSVPGFPQDAYMEGPTMAMDDMVQKPENYGLRPGWSGFMQGMMIFVRVLPHDQYDQVMERIRQGQPNTMPGMPGMKHDG